MRDIEENRDLINTQIAAICSSPYFARSSRLKKFLKFVVTFHLNNPEDKLSSFLIASDCFNRDVSKDPNDAYVRNVASQTRASLKNYYASLDVQPEIVIQLADKGYGISFSWNEQQTPPPLQVSIDQTLRHTAEPAQPPHKLQPTIAVLPFQCLGGDELHGIVGKLLAGTLITNLAQSKYLHVLSSRTTSRFETSSLGTQQLGRALNADYIAEGRFYVQGNTVRLQVELSSSDYDEVIWADQFRSEIDAVVSESDGLSEQILNGISRHLLHHELQRALSTPLQSLKCHSLLIGSINTMHRGQLSDLSKAKDMLLELQERNPSHATPFAHLAYWGILKHAGNGTHQVSADTRKFVEEHVNRALEIDSKHPIALTAKGIVTAHFDGNFAQARSSYEKAILYSPNETAAMGRLAIAQLYTDSASSALATAQTAIKLSPADPELHFYQGVAAMAYFGQRRYHDAIRSAEASYELFPNQLANLRTLIGSYTAIDEHKRADKYKHHLLRLEPSFNLQDYKENSPFPQQEIIQRLNSMLKQSGLPSCA